MGTPVACSVPSSLEKEPAIPLTGRALALSLGIPGYGVVGHRGSLWAWKDIQARSDRSTG